MFKFKLISEAVSKLGPDHAVPFLERWADDNEQDAMANGGDRVLVTLFGMRP
jgi:hypothetical protein